MKIIILEGPDGSGKTTLAEILRKDHQYKVVHNGPPETKELTTFYTGQLHGANADQHPTVFDRLHLGERIYGNVMRNKSLITPMQEKVIERHSEAMDAQVVLCLPPWRVILENWVKNAANEYVDTVEKLRTIYDLYLKHLYSRRPYVWFDYTRHRVRSFAAAIAQLEGNPLPKGVIGSQRPRFLFLTDPYMTNKAHSTMNNVIQSAGFSEQEIAFTHDVSSWNIGSTPKVIDLTEGIPPVIKLAEIRRATK